MQAARIALMTLALMALGGCVAMAVTGAVVGAGVAVGTAAVKTTVAVGKGAVAVATYPFRDSDAEKELKRQQEYDAEQRH